MVRWMLSNAAQLLETLRKYLGGTERPDQLYWYTGVMPTVDISTLTPGQTKIVNIGSITVSGTTTGLASTMTGPPSGKRWKVFAMAMSVTTGNVATFSVGLSNGLASFANFPVLGPITSTAAGGNTAFAAFPSPFYVTDIDVLNNVWELMLFCSAFTSAPVVQVCLIVAEESNLAA